MIWWVAAVTVESTPPRDSQPSGRNPTYGDCCRMVSDPETGALTTTPW
jgi:hypothetical protein